MTAVARNEPLWWQGPEYASAQEIAQSLSPQAWKRLSAGAGAKGERVYDWALAPLWRLQLSREERRWGHWLLVRRSWDDRQELAYYVVYAPRTKAKLKTLVAVARRRWEIEVGFEATKGECGLGQYELRRWQGWYPELKTEIARLQAEAERVRQFELPAVIAELNLLIERYELTEAMIFGASRQASPGKPGQAKNGAGPQICRQGHWQHLDRPRSQAGMGV